MFDIPQEKMFLLHQELQLVDTLSKTLNIDSLESMFVLKYIADGFDMIEAYGKIIAGIGIDDNDDGKPE